MEIKRWECTDHKFAVESPDEEEVVKMVRMHMKEKHNMEPSDEEIKSKIREI